MVFPKKIMVRLGSDRFDLVLIASTSLGFCLSQILSGKMWKYVEQRGKPDLAKRDALL